MTISIAGSSSPFLKQLAANGLGAAKAAIVETDMSAAQTATASATGLTISPTTRSAFDAKINADVLSGKLSASDAIAVGKTMDNLNGGSASSIDADKAVPAGTPSSQTAGAAGGAKVGGGNGGGAASATKTEASETVTISGSMLTTVITYTDGTTSTTTTMATDADKAKYEKSKPGGQAQETAAEYSTKVDKGALVDKVA